MKDQQMGSAEPHWIASGHLIKFEPGFVTRASSKTFSQKGLNHYNQVSPTKAFSAARLKTLTSSQSNYIKGEQTKREFLKSYTGFGETI
jgi:hypothetical protein